MKGRHRPPRTKRQYKQRAEDLADALTRSEESRVQLRDRLEEANLEIMALMTQLIGVRTELGSEQDTIPVEVVHDDRPLMLLKPPRTGQVPAQRPDGARVMLPVGKASRGRHRPGWAVG